MWPGKRDAGFDATVVIDCGQFGEFVNELLHVV